MEDWQQRVVDEASELEARGQKLHDFIFDKAGAFSTLPLRTQVQLSAQLGLMIAYHDVLEVRIDEFEN